MITRSLAMANALLFNDTFVTIVLFIALTDYHIPRGLLPKGEAGMTKEKTPSIFNYDLLRKMRKSAGYTLKQIAENLGVELNSVHNWEKGLSAPRKKNIKKLENLLGVKEGFFNTTINESIIDNTFTKENVTQNPPKKIQLDAWVYEFLLFLSLRETSLEDVDCMAKEDNETIQTTIISLKKLLMETVFKKQ